MIEDVSHDQDRKVPALSADAPAWARDLLRAAEGARAGGGGTMSHADFDAVIAAVGDLVGMTNYQHLATAERRSADRYQRMLAAAMPNDRARMELATMMAAATLAASGAVDAFSETPREGIAGRNLAMTMLAAAAVRDSARR